MATNDLNDRVNESQPIIVPKTDISFFNEQLELLAHQHLAQEPSIANCREYLSQINDSLAEAFKKPPKMEQLLKARSNAIDRLLIRIWEHCFGGSETPFCLVAVGGYGRAELHPFSDIDLLILTPELEQVASEHTEGIESFITWLWDLGLDIGHSVRHLNDCIEQAGADLTVMTNLMESRPIFGNTTLYSELMIAIDGSKLWPSEQFFQAKVGEQRQRHLKFRKTSYALEPNIKKSPGTLRDIQLVAWVANRHFKVRSMHELIDVDFLTEQEYEILNDCQEFLWTVRFALHVIANKAEDRLLFDYQKPVAEMLGFKDSEYRADVEHLMQRYYQVVKAIREINDMLLQHFSEMILNEDNSDKEQIIDDYFQRHGKQIEIRNLDVFQNDPTKLLELFLQMAKAPDIEGIRAPTLRQIFLDRNQIDLEKFQNNPRSKELFLDILRHPNGMGRAFNYMKRYGVLKAYLPAYEQILGQMQYDLFHIYTVDEHTLFVMNNIASFAEPESQEQFPLCFKVMKQIKQLELLLLGALFHDIGKGQGGDHSEIGAVQASQFCAQHGLSSDESELVSWLVQDHLIMSMTAQRKDITDPEVINQFASQVKNINNLNYLYLLTVADICATSPSLWNNWKDTLLSDLYRLTEIALKRGLENPQQTNEAINEVKQQILSELISRGYQQEDILNLWLDFKDDYFVRNPMNRISWQTRRLLKHNSASTLISIYRNKETMATEVFVYMKKHDHYFTQITSLMYQKKLSIQDASLHSTVSGYLLGSFVVLESDGSAIKDHRRVSSIKYLLAKKLKATNKKDLVITQKPHYRYAHFEVPTEIAFDVSDNGKRTLVEISALDRPGLLVSIGQAFQDCQLELHSAKVVTLGEKVEDVFAVTNRDDSRLDEQQQQLLSKAILAKIELDHQE